MIYLDEIRATVAHLQTFDHAEQYDAEQKLCALLVAYDALRQRVAEAEDKALRFDLDQLGIALREKEAVELVELRQRLANMELELTHATKTCAEQQWRAEQAQARLAVAEQTLKAHGIHVEEKWCWCGPTVEKHNE